jgi:hypothetical protein
MRYAVFIYNFKVVATLTGDVFAGRAVLSSWRTPFSKLALGYKIALSFIEALRL